MATIKAYTDLEQSKKLVEILPIDTADYCYIKYCTSDNNEWRYDGQPPMILGEIPITEITAECIPCWSLTALLDFLAQQDCFPEITYTGTCYLMNINFYDNEEGKTIHPIHFIRTEGNTLIDACVEMICKLKEKDLL